MLDLVGEGMVEAVRNRGFRVIEVSDADLDQISQIRLLIEVPVMGQVAKLLTPARVDALNQAGAAIEAAAERGDLIDYLDCDRKFHAQLVVAARQPAADRPGRPAAAPGPPVRPAGTGRHRPADGLGPRASRDAARPAVRRHRRQRGADGRARRAHPRAVGRAAPATRPARTEPPASAARRPPARRPARQSWKPSGNGSSGAITYWAVPVIQARPVIRGMTAGHVRAPSSPATLDR